jgi:hypothetical protein
LGKEDSHYIFKCVGAETRKWQTKSMGTIVEIRSTGAQSVLPPSRHPDGGRYFIKSGYEDFDFKLITKMEMERYGDEIAVSAVYVYHYPDEGSRHDYVHACTGTLCHAQWPDDKIKRVMGAVLTIVQNEETEMKDRKGSVVNTIEKHAAGDRTKGLTSLEAWMAADVIQGLRRWTGSGTMEGRLLTEPVRTTPKKDSLDFNPEWLQVPGLVGDVIRWAHKRSYIEQPVFDLAAGIMCTAIASCNHYLVQHWDTPLQPYIMITAPTATGKQSVLDVIGEFASKIALGEHLVSGVQSFYALLDTLGEDGMLHILWDEAARSMASAKRPEAAAYQLITHLLSLYGKGNGIVRAMPGRTKTIPELVHPFVTVLATAQPNLLMESLTSIAMETGYTNRFLLLDSGSQYPSLTQQRSKVFPSVIAKQGRMLRDHQPQEGEFTTIEFADAKTYASFQEFEEFSRRRAFRGEDVWGRANQSALILAGIAAVGVDPHRPEITEDLARWAMQLTSWSNDIWSDKMRLTGGGSLQENLVVKIQRMIERPMDFAKLSSKPEERHQLALMRQGFMPDATLRRGTRNIKQRERKEILDDLSDSGVISSMEKTHGPNGRYTNIVYFAQ